MSEETKTSEEPVLSSFYDWFQSARQAGNRPTASSVADAVVQSNELANQSRALGREAPPLQQQGPADIQQFGGIDGGAGGREDVEGQGALANTTQGIFQGMYGPTGPGVAIMDEGENFLPFGGQKGRENVEETFVKQPEQMAQAVRAGAQAQQDESKQKEQFYGVQRDRTRDYEAALKEQYMLRQQETQARLQHIEQTAQKYTNDLADKGAFWHNPQNVMAAMGAALMQLTTDDRSFGYKLLNGAIQADIHNRRSLADQHLGYLKSNMAEYDRIAGDRIAGMQLAEAEAKRVAAYELERIAAQFQGPKAKANAEAIISKLKIDAMEGFMNAYRSGIYNKPQAVSKPILNSYEKTGKATPSGYHSYAGKPGGAMGAGNQGRPGMPAQAGQAMGGGVPGNSAGSPQVGGPPVDPKALKVLESRYPGATDLINNGYSDVRRRAYIKAGVRPGTPPELMSKKQKDDFNEAVYAQESQAYEELKPVAANLKGLATRNAGLKAIVTDMKLLQQATEQYGMKMDDVLSSKSRTVMGNETLMKLNQLYEAHIQSDPEHRSKWEEQRNAVNAAANRFMQLLSGDVREYYKSIGGSALTAVELPGLKQYADTGAPFSHIYTYVSSEANKAHAEERNQFQQLSPAAQAMALIQMGTKQTPINTQSVDGPESKNQHKQSGAPKKGK